MTTLIAITITASMALCLWLYVEWNYHQIQARTMNYMLVAVGVVLTILATVGIKHLLDMVMV